MLFELFASVVIESLKLKLLQTIGYTECLFLYWKANIRSTQTLFTNKEGVLFALYILQKLLKITIATNSRTILSI